MNRGEALAQIRAALGQAGFRPSDDDPSAFVGEVVAADRRVLLEVTIPCHLFSRLPRLRLLRREEDLPDVVAHIEAEAILCYAAPGSLVLDHAEPGNSILTALEQARITLRRIVQGDAGQDVAAEFPQHWLARREVLVALPPDAQEGPASLLEIPRLGAVSMQVLTRRGADSVFDGGAMGRLDRPEAARAWIGRTPHVLTLDGRGVPANLRAFLSWAEEIDPALSARLAHAAAHLFFKEPIHLFVLGPNGCVGGRLTVPPLWEKAARTKPFWAGRVRAGGDRIGLDRLSGARMDAEHARTRNLPGRPTLAGRLVLQVGCGSIGSHLARLLVQCGAGQGGGRLLLLDKEILTPGNLGRHWLGAEHVGSGKANACEAELRRTTPGVAVQGIAADVMQRLDLLARADLFVDATGEEALSRALNHEIVARRPHAPAAIFVWLAGEGAAAQVVHVPSVADDRGCLACCRPYGMPPAVLREGATGKPALAACGEAEFMPYGVAAPAVAAGLAAAMAMEWAGGDVRPTLRTVRIDHAATCEVPDRDVPARPGCPDCGMRSR